jgi:hypothetical protein
VSLLLFFTGAKAAVPKQPPQVGSSITGGYFSKKKWHVVIGEIRAERKALLDANLAKRRRKQQEALEAAAARTREALLEAEVTANEAHQEAGRLLAALRATGAAKAQDLPHRAREAENAAEALLRAMRDHEDEDAIMLLLLH